MKPERFHNIKKLHDEARGMPHQSIQTQEFIREIFAVSSIFIYNLIHKYTV